MTKPKRRAVLCLVAGLTGAQAERGAHAQTKPDLPSFAAGVELITVDAVVFDGKGRLVTGLTKDDFVVTEDGKVQPVASFEAFVQEAGEEEETPLPQAEASNAPAARRAGRAFAVVVDDARMSTQRSDAARGAVASFLERAVRDGDLVTLADTSGSVWWSARIPEGREDLLAVLSRVKGHDTNAFAFERMTNYEAFWIAKYGDSPGTGSAPGSFSSGGSSRGGGAEPLPAGVGNITTRVMRRWAADNLCQEPSCEQLVRGRAVELDARRRGSMKLTLAATRRALDALAPIRGRKSLLLISEGFIDDLDPEQREVAAASREANTAVYFLDVKGLLAIPAFGSASDAGVPPDPRDQQTMALEETTLEAAGAEELADATGGFSVRGTNDFASGMERIAEESRRFYLLGFYPPEGKSAREWRKLKVAVRRPGLKVRARRGYTLRTTAEAAPPPKKGKSATPAASPALAQALDSAHDAPGIPLRAMAYVLEAGPKNTVHVLVASEVDVRGLGTPAGADAAKTRLEVSVVAVNRDSGRGFRHDDILELPAAAGPPWRSFVREFELPPGVTQAHVVVRDPVKGILGSVSQRFEVPPAGHLRVTTPLLTDSIVPSKDPEGPPQPALAAHRLFRPQGGLYIQYEVIGAALDPERGVPQVVAGLELWAPGNRLVRKLDPTPIGVDLNARVVRQMGIALDGMPAGPYDLVLDVRDEVSGARLKQREPFVLTADAAAR